MHENDFVEKKIRQAHRIATGLWEKGKHEEGNRFLRVAYAGKGIVAEVTAQGGWFWSENELKPKVFAFYPSAEHAEKFAAGIEKLRQYGPAQFFPGSVGSLMVTRSPHDINMPMVEHIQGHFKQKNSPEIPRSLATKYGGWRMHLLKHLFKTTKARKIFFRRPIKPTAMPEIIKAGEQYGFIPTTVFSESLVMEKK